MPALQTSRRCPRAAVLRRAGFACLALLAAAGAARAGAWPRDKGHSFVATASQVSATSLAGPVASYSTVYIEHGLGRNLTLGADLGHGISGKGKAVIFLRKSLPERPGVQVRWLHRDGAAPGTTTLLADAVAELHVPSGHPYVWGGAESRAMRDVRRHVRDAWGLHREQVSLLGYWRRSADDADDADADDDALRSWCGAEIASPGWRFAIGRPRQVRG